jgi:LacI family transcriptional regulator
LTQSHAPVRRQRRPNQADIAREASVSTATVSRVVNNAKSVSPTVRRRVLAEIEKRGYYPHAAARALAYHRSRTIGAVVPTLKSDLFARGIDALARRLRQMDYSLMVVASDYSLADEWVLVRRLLERGVDGLFLIGQQRYPGTLALLEESRRPFVESYISDDFERDGYVGFCNAKAAASVVDYLVALGHRRIAMFAGITDGNDRAYRRLAGVRARLGELGIPLLEHHTPELPYDVDAARAAFGNLCESASMPTALICGNDLIAMGVLVEAQARSINIPKHLSVVGFDNHPLARHTWPPLTTIDVPADEIGRRAADALVNAIEHGVPVGKHELEAPLVVRDTTAPPRQPE